MEQSTPISPDVTAAQSVLARRQRLAAGLGPCGTRENRCVKDVVCPLEQTSDDLLAPFDAPQDMATIKDRLAEELSLLPEQVKKITEPDTFPVEFRF